MKKIFIFSRFPFQSAFGGEEKIHLAMAEMLAEEQYTPFFLGSCRVMKNAFVERTFPTFSFPFFPDITSKKALLFSPISVFLLFFFGFFFFGMLKKKGAKDLLCMTYIDKIALTLPAKLWGFRVFWGHHAALGKWFFANPFSFLWKKFSAFATVLVPSSAVKNQLQSFFPSAKVQVLYNFVDTPSVTVNAENQTDENGVAKSLKIGFLGRLSPEKNAEIFVFLAEKFPNHFFLMGGEGEQRNFLESIAPQNLQFLGFLDENAKEIFFSQIDVLVFPSKMETFGLVAAEAMIHGVLVMASDLEAVREVVLDSGILVKMCEKNEQTGQETGEENWQEKNKKNWENAFAQMLKNPENRKKLAKMGKMRAEKFFSKKAFEKAWKDVFL